MELILAYLKHTLDTISCVFCCVVCSSGILNLRNVSKCRFFDVFRSKLRPATVSWEQDCGRNRRQIWGLAVAGGHTGNFVPYLDDHNGVLVAAGEIYVMPR